MPTDQYLMWGGTAPRSATRQPAASGVQTSAGAPRTNTVQPGGSVPLSAPVAAPRVASDPLELMRMQLLAGGPGAPTVANIIAAQNAARQNMPASVLNRPAGGEGGAMGAMSTPAGAPMTAPRGGVGTAQRTLVPGQSGVGAGPSAPLAPPQNANAPQSAPAPGGYTPYGFTRQDIDYIAQYIDPQYASILGFGPGGAGARFGDFWSFMERRFKKQGMEQTLGNEFTAEDFRNTFWLPENSEMRKALFNEGNRQGYSLQQTLAFVDQLANAMEQIEMGRKAAMEAPPAAPGTPPGTPGTSGGGTPGAPGTYGEDELAAFRRPLAPEEQNLLDYVRAAQTGEVSPGRQAAMQAELRDAMQSGRPVDVSKWVGRVGEEQRAEPGYALYQASRGEIPEEQRQAIREQASVNLGGIGQRFSSDVGAALGSALKRAADERMMQGQQLLSTVSTQAALMQAQREQQAQQALYQEYLRSVGIDPEMLQLMNLIQLNRGQTTTSNQIIPGDNPYTALGRGLAEGGAITSSMGQTVPQQQPGISVGTTNVPVTNWGNMQASPVAAPYGGGTMMQPTQTPFTYEDPYGTRFGYY